jgi:hypothetical protein
MLGNQPLHLVARSLARENALWLNLSRSMIPLETARVLRSAISAHCAAQLAAPAAL